MSVDPEMLGRIFENLLAEIDPDSGETARKATGSFYTPREIVDYMAAESLVQYLHNKTGLKHKQLRLVFKMTEKELPQFSEMEHKSILNALDQIKILDPACGSGAFPMGVLQKIVTALQKLDPDAVWWKERQVKRIKNQFVRKALREKLEDSSVEYARKIGVIQNSLYGVDIQPIAAEISKLRCFLSLVVDETINENKPNRGIEPLPNLEFKFVTANTLLKLPVEKDYGGLFNSNDEIDKLEELRNEYLQSFGKKKETIKQQFLNVQKKMSTKQEHLSPNVNSRAYKLSTWDPFSNHKADWFDPKWMFGVEKFDVVLGNPPYVSTKGTNTEIKKQLKEQYGFADDLYNHFYFRGIDSLREKGHLSFITSKTFWTIQTKRNLRDLLLSKNIDYIFDTANAFASAMVDTCIIGISNEKTKEKQVINFLDGRQSLSKPKSYYVEQSVYYNSQNAVIFTPTAYNLTIYNKYGKIVKDLYDTWWDKISTSQKIAQNQRELEKYRKNLKAGDVALLGCLTEGGQGLATANNGKYIAVREKTKWAENIVKTRPKKLFEAVSKYNITEFDDIKTLDDANNFLNQKSEKEIALIFDQLKEKYGRDIFGQGYLFRIIDDNELADVDTLTEDEKQNGISEDKNYYVPYDKGDKDGNRWYLETPFAIAWSKENVGYLKTTKFLFGNIIKFKSFI